MLISGTAQTAVLCEIWQRFMSSLTLPTPQHRSFLCFLLWFVCLFVAFLLRQRNKQIWNKEETVSLFLYLSSFFQPSNQRKLWQVPRWKSLLNKRPNCLKPEGGSIKPLNHFYKTVFFLDFYRKPSTFCNGIKHQILLPGIAKPSESYRKRNKLDYPVNVAR